MVAQATSSECLPPVDGKGVARNGDGLRCAAALSSERAVPSRAAGCLAFVTRVYARGGTFIFCAILAARLALAALALLATPNAAAIYSIRYIARRVVLVAILAGGRGLSGDGAGALCHYREHLHWRRATPPRRRLASWRGLPYFSFRIAKSSCRAPIPHNTALHFLGGVWRAFGETCCGRQDGGMLKGARRRGAVRRHAGTSRQHDGWRENYAGMVDGFRTPCLLSGLPPAVLTFCLSACLSGTVLVGRAKDEGAHRTRHAYRCAFALRAARTRAPPLLHTTAACAFTPSSRALLRTCTAAAYRGRLSASAT